MFRPQQVVHSVSCLVMCTISLLSAQASAQAIVDANGFEPPFSTTFGGTGQLEGQINPAGEGQALPPGQWQRTPGGTSTARVQAAVAASGSQAVRVDRAANNDVRWAVQVDHLGQPKGNFVSIAWDMRVNQTSGPPDTFGPFFGVEAYDDAVLVSLLGSLGVDASTGDVLFQAGGSGILTETGHVVEFGTWHRYQLLLDFGDDTYSYFLNGVQLGTEDFVDGPSAAFSDADISAFAAAGDAASQALTGTAYFDNFIVMEGVIDPSLPGDDNGDNRVDAADYVAWRKGLTPFGYEVWRTHFGESLVGGGSVPVPEPETVLVVVNVIVTILISRAGLFTPLSQLG